MNAPWRIGPYEILGELGRGAMAVVWRAWDPGLEREVAIKEPSFNIALSPTLIDDLTRRFLREGRTSASLQHPNIVSIYEANVYDGHPVIVMELVEGATLADLLRNGAFTPENALDVLTQLLAAVGYAHSKGVVHRDIKPENIFVDAMGHVKLADFGIAQVEGGAGTHATQVGTVLGTPGYMSPEQATGGTVDGRSDIFSIGVVGYEMLAGTDPFGASTESNAAALLYRIVHKPAPELPPIPMEGLKVDIRPVIMSALAKDPDMRPQTAGQFDAMLHGKAFSKRGMAGLGGAVRRLQGGGLPAWAPYAGVAAAMVAALGLFVIASPGGGGAMGGDPEAVADTLPVTTTQGGGNGSDTTDKNVSSGSTYYLGMKNGKVAIYQSGVTDPVEVSDLEVADLGSAEKDSVYNNELYTSKSDAEAQVSSLRKAAQTRSGSSQKAPATEQITVKNRDGTTRTATVSLDGASGRVFTDSNSRELTDAEVAALSDAERCIAWNEIIAAETGYVFKNTGLNAYFNSRDWYRPDPSGASDATGVGRSNVRKLQGAVQDSWWRNLATS